MSPTPLDLPRHTRQIRALAYRYGVDLPRCSSVEDLAQVGWVALLRCQARYQASPATLATYAYRRIAGAMQDEKRRLDARSHYEQRHGTAPYTVCPLEDTRRQSTPAAAPEPFLAALVARLPARLQLVLRLSYVESWTLREIGAALGCHESRVSQLRTEALALLRHMLEATP